MFDSWINGDYRSRDDLRADCWLLEESDIFDAGFYRRLAKLPEEIGAAEHYLREGWRQGLEPGPNFEGKFLYPYFQSVGFHGPPAITYLTLRASGWPVYPTRAYAESQATLIRSSSLFDAVSYAVQLGGSERLDPVLHYLIVGERIGRVPSKGFEPGYYGESYPDIKNVGFNYLFHYIHYGRKEGRRPLSAASALPFDLSRLDPARETILLAIHQASRTGAPILGYNIALHLRRKYNVVALLLAGGELVEDFRSCSTAVLGPFSHADWHPLEMHHAVKRILDSCHISYAIANSIDCRRILKSLTLGLVPTVTLVHEFSSYVQPKGEMGRALEWTTKTVFSAEIVAASARADYPNLDNRRINILPQGPLVLPPREPMSQEEESLRAVMRPPGTENSLVVLGCGTITFRKGVDVFLNCAAAVSALGSKRPIRFVWIGAVPDTDVDRKYFASLSKRSARERHVAILNEVSHLENAYALADVFFLSSRLDPLPNVCIDAALRGMPIVCFEGSSGVAELLKADPVTRVGVVPPLDARAAARVIAQLANDDVTRKEVSAATRRIADQTFDMDRYINDLDKTGREAADMMKQRVQDFETIASDLMFDASFFLEQNSPASRAEAIRLYLARSAVLGVGTRPTVNFYYRRPCPAFHPQVYAHEKAGQFDPTIINPLAHFIRAGKPDGPWRSEVITPFARGTAQPREAKLRAAIHGHFYYPEFAADFVRKLAVNRSECDLLLTTSNRFKAWKLRRATENYDRGKVLIRVVPNRGRDIGAFLSGFPDEMVGRYDLVGHLHGKRSLFLADRNIGKSWREFAWQNLLGDLFPMMDIVLNHMAEDESLGLVFASDPHLSDWDLNRQPAEKLARRMGLSESLPPFFDFPIGTMFWARPEALKPLFDLKLDWNDFPREPAPHDGSILHAIERLLPFVARHAGYRYATTYVPTVTW